MADREPLKIRYEKAKGRRADGSIDPLSIPVRMKYQIFVRHYDGLFSTTLGQQLTPADDATLKKASASLQAFLAQVHLATDEGLSAICNAGGGKEVEEIAQEVDAVYEASNSRLDEHYRNILASLSKTGNTTVEAFVDDVVARRINVVLPPSAVEQATDDPDEFRYWFELECHRVTTGDYPPDVKDRMKQVAELLPGIFDKQSGEDG